VNNHNRTTIDVAEGDQSFFAIIMPIVDHCVGAANENFWCIEKIKPTLLQRRLLFRRVKLNFHETNVTTLSQKSIFSHGATGGFLSFPPSAKRGRWREATEGVFGKAPSSKLSAQTSCRQERRFRTILVDLMANQNRPAIVGCQPSRLKGRFA
jgi:hypothetical protein